MWKTLIKFGAGNEAAATVRNVKAFNLGLTSPPSQALPRCGQQCCFLSFKGGWGLTHPWGTPDSFLGQLLGSQLQEGGPALKHWWVVGDENKLSSSRRTTVF